MHSPQEPSVPPRPPQRQSPVVIGVRFDFITTRDLKGQRYAARCPRCGNRRMHIADGTRRCPCGQSYRLVVGAVV